MSLLAAALLWIALAIAVGLGAGVAACVGYLYGRLARGLDDETAVRWTNVVTIGSAALAAIGVWIVVDAGAAIDEPVVPGGPILSGLVAGLAGGLAAGVVGAGAIGGILRARSDLPNVDDPAATRRQYARYLLVLFAVVLVVVSAIGPALRTGPIAIAGVVTVVYVGFWALGPVLNVLSSSTRRPTDGERTRIAELLETADVDVRGVRIVDDEGRVSVDLSGVPGGRFLFVSAGALAALGDETLAAMLVAGNERPVRYQPLVVGLPILAAVAIVAAVLLGDLAPVVGVPLAALAPFAGLALSRRLRFRADARAATRVGPRELADAYERAYEAAGIELENVGGRALLASRPPITARIERLRRLADERAEPTA